jgi:hypothetical protein
MSTGTNNTGQLAVAACASASTIAIEVMAVGIPPVALAIGTVCVLGGAGYGLYKWLSK